MNKVLITNALLRMSLAATRSLGQKEVQVLLAEEIGHTPAMYSKYCNKRLVCPNPSKKPEHFYYWLKEVLSEQKCDVLFPMDDDAMGIAVKYKEELEKICKLPIPSNESYSMARDKSISQTIAREAGLNCPITVIPTNIEQLDDIARNLEYPVLVKPRKSSGSRGIIRVNQQSEFRDAYLHVNATYSNPFIQKYVQPSAKYGVCLLFNQRSELRASFVQKLVRHFPLDIGTSVVQESVSYPELVEQAVALMQKLKWYGVAEVEFLVDKNGKAYFLEINPRFWGCLHMSIIAGIDFPWLLYRLAMDGDIKGDFKYQEGIKCRSLLPGDILHFITNKHRFKMNPPFLGGKKNNVYDDVLSLEDPLPTLGFFLSCLYYLPDSEMWKFVLKGD